MRESLDEHTVRMAKRRTNTTKKPEPGTRNHPPRQRHPMRQSLRIAKYVRSMEDK